MPLYLLARDYSGLEAESLIAGAAFALSPVLIARGAGHYSLVAAAPLPIFGLLLRRLGATGQVRYACGLGAVVAWATCSDAYYGVFCLLMAGLTLLVQFVSVERAVDAPVVQHRRPAPHARRAAPGGRQLRLRDRAPRRRLASICSASTSAPTRSTRRCSC